MSDKKQTSVEWLLEQLEPNILWTDKAKKLAEQAKEMEKQQKIAYKISTPLGHVAHCIEKYGIEIAISEYKCKLVNNKESKFWNDCIKIAKFYNETFNKEKKP
jgi:DNA polymerase I-like protein with 3'-5' exonuclease and polymerase domains